MSKQHSDALVFVTVQKRGLKSVLKFNEVEAGKSKPPTSNWCCCCEVFFFCVSTRYGRWTLYLKGKLFLHRKYLDWKEINSWRKNKPCYSFIVSYTASADQPAHIVRICPLLSHSLLEKNDYLEILILAQMKMLMKTTA